MSTTDLFQWRAEYEDGTALDEYDAAGKHGFAEVDHSRLARFCLVPTQRGFTGHAISPTDDGKVAFFRRRTVSVNPLSGEQALKGTVHCIGIEREQNSIYYFILPDGRVLASDDLNAV